MLLNASRVYGLIRVVCQYVSEVTIKLDILTTCFQNKITACDNILQAVMIKFC